MITIGSVSRAEAAARFSCLGVHAKGRRTAIRALTHRQPDFVFWIYPDGRLHDARDSHAAHPPRGFEHIVHDEPDYEGFLRGRVVSLGEDQLVVVYCRSEALAASGPQTVQLVRGLSQLPVPLLPEALVISDNADLYGTFADISERTLLAQDAPV